MSAVKLVNEQGYTTPAAAKSLGVDPNCVRGWVAKLSAESGVAPTGEGALMAEVRQLLRKDNARLRMRREIFKSGSVFRRGAGVIFAFVEGHLADAYPVVVSCDVLGVNRSGYYAWLGRPASARSVRRGGLAAAIARVHEQNRGVYGSPRVHQAPLAEGESACENTVVDVMREREIRAKTKRPFTPRTTDAAHEQPAARNGLDRQFDAALPDTKWVVDITHIPTGEGWLNLAGVMNLFSRKTVGWSMAGHMETSLVSDALRMAIAGRSPGAGLVHHIDRGSRYASENYLHLLRAHGMEVSMSGVGQCWDNAAMESFWSTLTSELVHHERYEVREQARASTFGQVEVLRQPRAVRGEPELVHPPRPPLVGKPTAESTADVIESFTAPLIAFPVSSQAPRPGTRASPRYTSLAPFFRYLRTSLPRPRAGPGSSRWTTTSTARGASSDCT